MLFAALYPLESGINKSFDWDIFVLVEFFAAVLLFLGMILEGRDEL